MIMTFFGLMFAFIVLATLFARNPEEEASKANEIKAAPQAIGAADLPPTMNETNQAPAVVTAPASSITRSKLFARSSTPRIRVMKKRLPKEVSAAIAARFGNDPIHHQAVYNPWAVKKLDNPQAVRVSNRKVLKQMQALRRHLAEEAHQQSVANA